jgi:hypothetical protein
LVNKNYISTDGKYQGRISERRLVKAVTCNSTNEIKLEKKRRNNISMLTSI